jgi:site-specific recombinase XerD
VDKEKRAVEESLPSLAEAYLTSLQETKSSLSVSNYRGDLLLFFRFLSSRGYELNRCTASHLTKYDFWLAQRGAAINTRRRKILSARSLIRFAAKKAAFGSNRSALFFRAPARKDRLGYVLPVDQWKRLKRELKKSATPLGKRNRLLVSLLAGSGMLVAEACALRWANWKGTRLVVSGKRARTISLDKETQELLKEWRAEHRGIFVFPGHNRHGLQTQKMTPRGVELLFAAWAEKLALPRLKPKTLRHFAISEWLREGRNDQEIRIRLGVTSSYPLDLYKKHVAQN